MWREKRRRCLERRRQLIPASELRQQDQEQQEEVEAVAAGRRSPPRSSLNVEPLLPGDISALRQIYLRKRFDPPKYNFAEALRQRAASSDSTDTRAEAVPKFAANHRLGRAQSLVVDLDDFGRDVLMWEPPKEWRKWQTVPMFDPVVMPNRRPGSAYAAIVDSTVRQWRLESFKDHGRLHKIRQHSQDHEKHIQKELVQETVRRENITGNNRRRSNSSSSRRRLRRPASAGHSGRRRLSGGRRRDNGKRSKKDRVHTGQGLIKAIDKRLGELDQTHYLMTGYEREQAGMRRKPRLRALKMKTKKEKTIKKTKKKKKKKKKKKEQKEEDEDAALDPRARKRKHRRQSLAIELLRKRRTLTITADDLAKSNTLREVFLESARRSVSADRAAFWVFDEAPFELWTFSAKGDAQVLRVGADTGIVGQCFMQGSAVIIHDAYKLKTFSAKMDRRTGYLTKSVLCIPCHGEDESNEKNGTRTNLGCVQLLNKKNEEGKFSLRDASLVQLQLMILRAYIREFPTKEGLEANISQLASALREIRQATKDADEDSLKVRFAGLAKEYGNFNRGGGENGDDDHADGKAPRKEREDHDDETSSEEEEEEYVLGVRNDFSGGVRSRADVMLMPVTRGQFMGSTSFFSSDIKSSDLERQAAPSNKFDRNPWQSRSPPSF